MPINVILFGEAGVGKSSVINLLAGKPVFKTSTDARRCTMESQWHTLEVEGKTFNVWETPGLGEPSFAIPSHLSDIGKMYMLIQQIEQQGGPDLLLFCMSGGSRVTQSMLHIYRLFFEVLCGGRVPIAAVVTRLEAEEKMEDWWLRNEEHVTLCGLKFSGHVCVTGLPRHQKAAEGRAALGSLLLRYGPREQMSPASDWFSGYLERLSIIPRPGSTKDERFNLKTLERMLRDHCMMDSEDARRLAERLIRDNFSAPRPTGNPIRVQPQLGGRSATWPPLGRSSTEFCRSVISSSADWLKRILGSSFPLYADDIVVFLIGPSGSGKSAFIHAVAQAHYFADIGQTIRHSTRKVQAIRYRLTQEGRTALRAGERTNVVFVNTPSFSEGHTEAAKDMDTWLKRSKSKSTRFGTIYLDEIEMDPATNTPRVQKQLDTFAGTLPENFTTQAQRLHCVVSGAAKIDRDKVVDRLERFQDQLNELRPRVVNGWRPKWNTSIHPKLFVIGDSDTAWKAVEALFSSP